MKALFHGALTKNIRKRLVDFAQRTRHGPDLGLFYERQLSTLQQIVILNAPESSDSNFDSDDGRDDLARALFMMFDVMNSGQPADGPASALVATLTQHQLRMAVVPSRQYAARALHFYELTKKTPSEHVQQYLALFRHATDVEARDYILGGLAEILREEGLDPKEIAEGWRPAGAGHNYENPLEAEIIKASGEADHPENGG
jgi:hypothetical protein